jgi:hypothetical protein
MKLWAIRITLPGNPNLLEIARVDNVDSLLEVVRIMTIKSVHGPCKLEIEDVSYLIPPWEKGEKKDEYES